jgi:replicative DNA helicase
MFEKYSYDGSFQDLLLASIIAHPERFMHNAGTLNSAYFTSVPRVATARALFAYWNKNGRFPQPEALSQIVYDAILRSSDAKEEGNIMAFVRKITTLDTSDVDYAVEKTVEFARERALYIACDKAINYHKTGEAPPGGFTKLFEDALKVGQNLKDIGYRIKSGESDIQLVLDTVTKRDYGIQTGFGDLDRIWPFGWGPGWLIAILAPPKRYKCESPDTQILMFDGTIKQICQLAPGDKIMGDDGTPRNVLSCGRGCAPMYRVTQANGDSYTVTHDHILCVKRPPGTVPVGRFTDRYHLGEILEITAEDYAKKSANFHRDWKGYKVRVDFPAVSVPLDPYFLGLWLGDGSSHEASISVGDDDPEITPFLHDFATKAGLRVTTYRKKTRCTQVSLVGQGKGQNPIINGLRALNLLRNKHIPFVYKINSQATRLRLLAGLIDSDGSHANNRGFIFTDTNRLLCEDTCWLARSLGFKSFIRPFRSQCIVKGKKIFSIAYRTYVQGRISEIPTKVARKHGTDSKKASDRTTIKVAPVGNQEWFGIEIDGNRRYLHSDFTVTHNTAFCINLAMNMIENTGSPVFYYPCEISQELAAVRCLCNLTDLPFDMIYQNKKTFTEKALQMANERLNSTLLIKGFPSRAATISGDIRSHALTASARFGVKPKAIIIDFAETVKPSSDPKRTSEWRAQGEIYLEARALGSEFGCPVILPDRCNKETVDLAVPSMKSFQGSFEKAGIVDVAIGLCATDDEYAQNIIRYFVFLNRHGTAYQHFRGNVEPRSMTMSILEKLEWRPEEDQGGERPGHRLRRRRQRPPLDRIED